MILKKINEFNLCWMNFYVRANNTPLLLAEL
jgi:hypothetical protein